MSWLEHLITPEWVLPGRYVLYILILATILLGRSDRRAWLLGLLLFNTMLAFLIGQGLYPSLVIIQAGLGVANSFILYVAARDIERFLKGKDHLERTSGRWRGDSFYRTLSLALGGTIAYLMWKTYPLQFVPTSLNLVAYWTLVVGALLTLLGSDPLGIGIGILAMMAGFQGLFIYVEQSFAVTGLLDVLSVLTALTVAVLASAWLEMLDTQGTEA